MLSLSFFIAGGLFFAACLVLVHLQRIPLAVTFELVSLFLAGIGAFLSEGSTSGSALLGATLIRGVGLTPTFAVVGGIVYLTGQRHFLPARSER